MFKGIPGIALFVGIGIGFATAASITACAFPDAIPGRLARLENARQAVVVTGSDTNNASGVADFVLAERDIELGLPGRLGVMLASEDAGLKVREVRPASPAEKAGFLPDHRIHSIAVWRQNIRAIGT